MHRIKLVGLVLGPLLALAIGFSDLGADPLQTKVMAVAAWMLLWWVLEAVELYVTAMLPMVLFPMLAFVARVDRPLELYHQKLFKDFQILRLYQPLDNKYKI